MQFKIVSVQQVAAFPLGEFSALPMRLHRMAAIEIGQNQEPPVGGRAQHRKEIAPAALDHLLM